MPTIHVIISVMSTFDCSELSRSEPLCVFWGGHIFLLLFAMPEKWILVGCEFYTFEELSVFCPASHELCEELKFSQLLSYLWLVQRRGEVMSLMLAHISWKARGPGHCLTVDSWITFLGGKCLFGFFKQSQMEILVIVLLISKSSWHTSNTRLWLHTWSDDTPLCTDVYSSGGILCVHSLPCWHFLLHHKDSSA